MSFFTVFPGAEAYDIAEQYGTFDKSWEKINAFAANFIPDGLTREEVEHYHSRAYRVFYFRPRIVWYFFTKLIRNPELLPKLFMSFIALIKFTGQKNKRGQPI